MTVRFVGRAEQDLEDIADFIARDNPARALSFVREIRVKAVAIDQTPRAFPLLSRYKQHGIRRRIHRDYAILYRVDGPEVTILHILHTARDIDAILADDDI